MTHRRRIILASTLLIAAAARGQAQPVVPGTVTIGLQPVLNTFSLGFPGVSVPIDMNGPGDGRQYIAANSGHIIMVDGANRSMFLDLDAHPNVPFTTSFAATVSIAFHPNYLNEGLPGYHKFYTYSSDFKTVNQIPNTASTVTPGNQLTGLPDFWHPEMYAPATTGNPLTNWTNPNSPDSGNTDFDHFNVIREWTASANGLSIDTSLAPRVVLRMAHGFQNKGSHNGGGFRFGPDGYLYLSTGDGGGNAGQDHDGGIGNSEDGHTDGTGNAQDRTVVYGKVLRIDPTAAVKNSANGQYGIPADNPYVIDATHPEYVNEIYAYGFRNPWKLSFDDAIGGDGALYLANVGQHHREEIDVITAGGNYGWGYLEGNVRLVSEANATGAPDPGDLVDGTNGTPIRVPAEGWDAFTAAATPPLADYLTRRQTVGGQLVGDGTAVTGGHVYRGAGLPDLVGKYVFGDLSIAGSPPPGLPANKGRLFYLDLAEPAQIFELQVAFGAAAIGQLLGFGEDDAGELYALFDNGNVTRLVGLPPGDFNQDGDVDAADLNDATQGWRARFGVDLDGDDFLTWQQNLGLSAAPPAAIAVPEPAPNLASATVAMLMAMPWIVGACRRRNCCRSAARLITMRKIKTRRGSIRSLAALASAVGRRLFAVHLLPRRLLTKETSSPCHVVSPPPLPSSLRARSVPPSSRRNSPPRP